MYPFKQQMTFNRRRLRPPPTRSQRVGFLFPHVLNLMIAINEKGQLVRPVDALCCPAG